MKTKQSLVYGLITVIIARGKDAAVSTAKAKGFWWSMRSILLCIIAAWTLLLCTLSLTGCPPEPDDGTLSGNVAVSPNGTVNVNTELTAAYSGTETVTYQWYKDNVAISGAKSPKYTPTVAGSYTVTVSASGYTSKTSLAVTVIEPDPTHTHQWGAWTETTPATCTTEGEETRTCTLDATHQETQPIAALGHDWGNWVVTTPATTTADGEETRTCKHDPTHTETQTIAKLNPTCPCPPNTVHPYGTTCPSNCEAKGTPYCTCSIDVKREFKIGNVAIRDSRAANPSDQTLEQLGVIGKFTGLLDFLSGDGDATYDNIASRGLMIVLEDGVGYDYYRAIDGNTIGANLTWVLATANIASTSNSGRFTTTLSDMQILDFTPRTIARARVQGKTDIASAGGVEPPMKKGKYSADYRKLVAGVTGTNLPSVVMRHGTLQGVCRKICFYRSYIGLLKTASLF